MESLAQKKIYTVSQLTKDIRAALAANFSGVWLTGEISNFREPLSGHKYFTLKDENSQIGCVIFKGRAKTQEKFKLEDGIKVVCFGRVSVYEKSGQYQFYIDQIQLVGIGALQLAFEQLKAKLEKEGLFDPIHKKPIPMLPQIIGVVTSPTGAAIRDILNILDRRFSNVRVILNPVRVQGDLAAKEIANAIDEFNEYEKPDVLIVGRGGGSLEDLWAFNEEVVARAIWRSNIPVISAVGHEIDWTISDFVADKRAPTPSAAAELVIMRRDEIVNTIDSFKSRIKTHIDNKISYLKTHVDSLKQSYVFQSPRVLVEQNAQKLDETLKYLDQQMRYFMALKQHDLNQKMTQLEELNPLTILRRGYSITKTKENKIITDAEEVKAGDIIRTKLHKGEIISRVE